MQASNSDHIIVVWKAPAHNSGELDAAAAEMFLRICIRVLPIVIRLPVERDVWPGGSYNWLADLRLAGACRGKAKE
jgi:hypothetical protein